MTGSLFAPWKQPAMTLRPYQQEAVAALYKHLRERDDNPCIVIPTGGGKTPVIATICRDAVKQWGGRVIVLAHVKELLEQSADKLRQVCPDVPVGLYSAGLNSREKKQGIIVAGIQSVYQKACDFEPFDLAIADECHLIPPDGEGMYRTLLGDLKKINPQLRVIGLTATPFRMTSGAVCTPDGILNSICYEVGVRQLIVDGFLSPLVSKAGKARADTASLHVRGGEYIASEVESLMDETQLVEAACQEIAELTRDRRAVLIFAAGIDHGLHVCNILEGVHGQTVNFVHGDTPAHARATLIDRFRSGSLKYLVNVNVLTTGFDAPNVDCVVLLRPTLSPGLYYQMVGRGFRLAPGKSDCLVLDFGGNVLRHGPVDMLTLTTARVGGSGESPAKECPQCQAVVHAGYARCPQCGYEFPPPERDKHEATASNAGVLSGQISEEVFQVEEVAYNVHHKRGDPDALPTMRVDYRIGLYETKSEWICIEHQGFARDKAVKWWVKRSNQPFPETVEAAVSACRRGAVAETFAIKVRSVAGERYERIVDYELGEKSPLYQDEEIPF